MENQFDLIVIGSGIGGLTVASVYSQFKKKKVLVLERHFKLGGFTHTFRREGKYEWDVGVHYLGNMQEGSHLRKLMDVVTGKKVKFNKMPHIFEKFIYPDFQFELPSNENEYKEKLKNLFPEEVQGIERYFRDIKDAAEWFGKYTVTKSAPKIVGDILDFVNSFGKDPSSITTKEYLDKTFKSEKLKAILVSQWGDYGLPPAKSSFVIHALIAEHYLNGGYYPDGTARKIAESVKEIVESYGGKLLINNKVTEIIIQKGKAVGVKVIEKKGGKEEQKEYYAPIIVSNAGAYTTYISLIPRDIEIPFREELKTLQKAPTSVILFLGFNKDPREYGFYGENYWIYDYTNHDEAFEKRNLILEGKPSMVYLSFPSLKDNSAVGHTGELISIVDYEPFAKWKDKEWKNRGEDYMALKEKIAQSMIELVAKHFPKFPELIAYKELSTPITNEGFTGHPQGSIYGLPCTVERFSKKWLGAKTPIENLYLTGADALSPGIAGALGGGFSCLAHLLGPIGLAKAIITN